MSVTTTPHIESLPEPVERRRLGLGSLTTWRLVLRGATLPVLLLATCEEAVYLGDRVVVMQPRLGRIKRIVEVDLRRPRDRGAAGFAAIKDDVLSEFGEAPRPALVVPSARLERALSDWQFAW